MAPLYTADLDVVIAYAEDWSFRNATKLSYVARFTVEHGPSDVRADGGFGDLGQRSSANRLENDGVRTVPRSGLDRAKQLRTLINRVVFRVDYLCFDVQAARGFLGGLRLFDLIIVVVGGQRNQNAKFFHGVAPASRTSRLYDKLPGRTIDEELSGSCRKMKPR